MSRPGNHHVLCLRRAPALRLDARALQPARLAAMTPDQVRRLELPLGSDRVTVGELFEVRGGEPCELPTLSLEGDLRHFDDLGAGLAEGLLEIRGGVGDALGCGQSGGRIEVHGQAGDLAGCSLRGGWLEIHGDVGDLAASALPGDMDGMRGGTLVIHGNAGARLADRMRRGTLVVHGDTGDFAASRMVAGTLAIAGRTGAHCGYGMRRGTLVFAGPPPEVPATFVETRHDFRVWWALLARNLQRFGGEFRGLADLQPRRVAGDLAVAGQGEWLMPP